MTFSPSKHVSRFNCPKELFSWRLNSFRNCKECGVVSVPRCMIATCTDVCCKVFFINFRICGVIYKIVEENDAAYSVRPAVSKDG